MGELHLEIIISRMLREFHTNVNVGKPQVVYRETIEKPGSATIIFDKEIAGQRHFAEISRFEGHELDYPLYEVTASGLNAAGAGRGEQNRFRLSVENFRADNFGLILVDWSLSDPLIRLQIRDAAGNTAAEHRLSLSELQPGRLSTTLWQADWRHPSRISTGSGRAMAGVAFCARVYLPQPAVRHT